MILMPRHRGHLRVVGIGLHHRVPGTEPRAAGASASPQELAHGSLRVTLGRDTTAEQIDHFIKVFPPIVARLREMSPIWCANCACKQKDS